MCGQNSTLGDFITEEALPDLRPPEPQDVIITRVPKKDAFYWDRERLVGLVGKFAGYETEKGYQGGTFYYKNCIGEDREVLFYAIKVKPVKTTWR